MDRKTFSAKYDPLVDSGELRDRANLALAATLRALLVVVPLASVANILGAGTVAETVLLLALFAYVAALFFLQRRGHFALCVHAVVFGLIVFSALIGAAYGSVRSVSTMAQVAAVTMGGIFLGRRAMVLAFSLSVASIAALIYAENAGWLPAPDYQVTTAHWVVYSLIIGAVALVLVYMRALLLGVVGQLGSELEQRRRAEAGRDQNEARFRRIFETSPVGMKITRLADGRYLETNPADQATLGYSREELIGRTVFEMNVWESAEERARFVAALRAKRRIEGYLARMRNKAGEMVDCRIWADLIVLDGEECILASMVNVTEQERAGRLLRQSEAKFAAVFDSAPDPIVVARERDAVQLEANAAWQRTTGYTREQGVGRSALELGLWADPGQRAQVIAQLESRGPVENLPVRFAVAGGAIIDVLLSGIRVPIDGEPCIVWSWRDVTPLRRVQAREQQARAKFQALFETSPEGIALTTWREAAILEANDAAQQQLGVVLAEVVGRPVHEIGIGAGAEDNAEIRERLRSEGRIVNRSTRFRRRDGEWLQLLLSAVRVVVDGEKCVVWSWRDVTEQRRAEEVKQQALHKFATLFETNPVGCILTRPRDHRIIEVNDAALRLLGVSREEALANSSLDTVRWVDDAALDEARRRVLAGERVIEQAAQIRSRSGEVLDTIRSASPISVDGESLLMITIRDVTEQRRAEEELRSSRRLLETVIDAVPMSIFAKDLNSNYILLNQRMAEFFGLPKEELLYRHTLSLPVDGESRDKSYEDDHWVFENLRTLDQPDVLLGGPDGVQHSYHSTKVPLFDHDGTLMGLVGVNRDISSEKRAQAALRESEQRYRSLFQALATPVVLSRLRDGVIVDVNDAWVRENGIAREKAVGQAGPSVGHWSDLEARARIVQQVLAEGRVDDHRVQFVRPDGRKRDLKVSCTRIELNSEPHLLWTSRDVTERRRNERLLGNIAKGVTMQTGADFFRTLVVALCRELPADVAFIGEVVGGGGRVRTIACCSDGELSDNFEYALAGSPCALALERRGSVIHPEGVAGRFPEDKGLAQRGISGYAGTSLFDAEGRPIGILVAMTRAPIERQGLYVSMLEIFAARAAAEIERVRAYDAVRELNLSLERRVCERTAELEAANRHLDSFGYSVAHDLRSPLGAIAGFADLLRGTEAGRLSDEGTQMLREIELNAERMNRMLEGLLQFSRLGHKPVVKRPVPMAALAGDVIEELRAQGSAPCIEFRLGALPESLGDPILLRQVWSNLLGNAVKYSRMRAPAIVEVGYEPARSAYYVRDNGVGFEMKNAGRLFGVFERLHSDAEFEGAGVGLAIVQCIVQRHGGEVGAESTPGRGATFRFSLPAS